MVEYMHGRLQVKCANTFGQREYKKTEQDSSMAKVNVTVCKPE
jgi:hypothetical protein